MRTIRNCNVAVVGGAGFLGSHLVNHLIEDRNCQVLVIDNLVAGRREFIHPKTKFVHHDITGSEGHLKYLLESALDGIRVDYVFNYAAFPYVPDSYARPKHVCEVNFNGAMSVINAAQDAGVKAILQVSSAEVYGDGSGVVYETHEDQSQNGIGRITEEAPVVPHSSYGSSKAAIDFYVQCAWKERKTPCIALRQFNCVGERETHPYIVPEIISQLEKQYLKCLKCKGVGLINYGPPADGESDTIIQCTECDGKGRIWNKAVVKLGNDSFRDFLYAGDAVKIAVELLERGEFGEVYNLGSETGIKMYDLAKLIGKVMGFADVQVERDEARVRPWEIWHLQADCSKLIQAVAPGRALNVTSLEDALRKTVDWFNKNGRVWPWER